MGVIAIISLIGVIAAQGAVVFATACLGLRVAKWSGRPGKIAAMAISLGVWLVITTTGYGLLGGEGGLTDGFAVLLALCFTATISSAIYTLIWLPFPATSSRAANRNSATS